MVYLVSSSRSAIERQQLAEGKNWLANCEITSLLLVLASVAAAR